MANNETDGEGLKIHREQPSADAQIKLEPHDAEVLVVVTRAYCPKGHDLVGRSEERFDGFPGISLWVEHEGKGGEVVVSPIHGDHDKRGATFPDGAKLSISCPECRTELPELADCNCSEGGRLRAIYLSPKLSESHMVAVCDIWGCPLSRVIDNFEMFSEFLVGDA